MLSFVSMGAAALVEVEAQGRSQEPRYGGRNSGPSTAAHKHILAFVPVLHIWDRRRVHLCWTAGLLLPRGAQGAEIDSNMLLLVLDVARVFLEHHAGGTGEPSNQGEYEE